ncbi:hypothetical protein ACFL42_00620 [Candidatus Omnitrophota bacterium]
MEYFTYIEKLKRFSDDHEDICRRCGECCGAADGDACVNLARDTAGKCYCDVYGNRFGHHKTASGGMILCVPIRDRVKAGSAPAGCPYNKT